MRSREWESFWSKKRNSEKDYLSDLLETLSIPVSSQALVFSTTSLQLNKISPQNPRAIYFNDNLYLGYVPGGHVEILGIDFKLGPVPYIFKFPESVKSPEITRSLRCMRCHAGPEQGGIPSLLLGSVIPNSGGGTYDKLNYSMPGHFVSYEKRFGGWYFSNKFSSNQNFWANSLVSIDNGNLKKIKIPDKWPFGNQRYPISTSSQVAHLVLEHQVGFTNICTKVIYKYRELTSADSSKNINLEVFTEDSSSEILEYLTFRAEPEIPGFFADLDPFFREKFEASGFLSSQGCSLREMDLKKRLFKREVSYMIFSNSFAGLPSTVRKEVLSQLKNILSAKLRSNRTSEKNQAFQTKVILEEAFGI